MRIISSEPCFRVADTARAMEHYQRLGFSTSVHDATYAFAHRDDLTIHLMQNDSGQPAPSTLYVHVSDADEFAAELATAGLSFDLVVETDYGLREGSHTDPDGNVIRFGSPTTT